LDLQFFNNGTKKCIEYGRQSVANDVWTALAFEVPKYTTYIL